MRAARVWAGGDVLDPRAARRPARSRARGTTAAARLARPAVACSNASIAGTDGDRGPHRAGAAAPGDRRLGVDLAVRPPRRRVGAVPLRPRAAADDHRRPLATAGWSRTPRARPRTCCRAAPAWPTHRRARRTLDARRPGRAGRDGRRRADEGLRLLAVAATRRSPRRRATPDLDPGARRSATSRCSGVVALVDPPRPEVAAAVAQCHAAGIRIIDGHRRPRRSPPAGRRAGRDRPRGAPRRHRRRARRDAARPSSTRCWRASEEIVFARTSPEAKLRIADALQDQGARRGHDRRRRQRRARPAPGRHRRRDGPFRHRRRPGGGRHGAHRRQLRHHRQRGPRPGVRSTTTSASSSSTSSPTPPPEVGAVPRLRPVRWRGPAAAHRDADPRHRPRHRDPPRAGARPRAGRART